MTDITTPIKFLNSTVVSFTSSLGFNSTPSTLNVVLVKDDDDSGFNPGSTTPDSFFLDGNPGTFAVFATNELDEDDDPIFSFGGIVQSYTRTGGLQGVSPIGSMSGDTVTVNLADPRILFQHIPVITNLNSLGASQDDNIIDIIGYYGGNIINADWNPDGITWSKIFPVLTSWVGAFYKKLVGITFELNELNVPTFIPHPNYRCNLQNPTLEELLDTVSRENSFDYYVTANYGFVLGIPNQIVLTIHGVRRFNQGPLENNEIQAFIAARADRVSNYEIGRELRLDPNNVMIFGDYRSSLYKPEVDQIYPIYNQTNDGSYTDRMFVSLESIESDNTTLIANLPYVDFEKKVLVTDVIPGPQTNGEITYLPSITYKKQRPAYARKGYMANEYILRAALHGKDAWAIALWYSFVDTSKQITYYPVDQYDVDTDDGFATLGEHSIANGPPIHSVVNVATAIGIPEAPVSRINLELPTPIDGTVLTASKRAVIEACYQVTLKMAEEYYGTHFAVRLPQSDIMDSIIVNEHNYDYSQRRSLFEYEVNDAAWIVNDPTDTVEDTLPYAVYYSDSDLFQNDNATVKCFARFDIDTVKGFDSPLETKVKLELLDTNSILKVAKTNLGQIDSSLIQPIDDYYLYMGNLSVEQYKYDPRIAIVQLPTPINIGYGPIRGVNVTSHTVTDGDGNVSIVVDGFTVGNVIPTLPTDEDTSGGAAEFFSWLYSDFQIVYNLVDGSNNRVNVIENGATKKIDLDYYRSLLDDLAFLYKDDIGFAPRRYTGEFEMLLPLRWNFLRYGPFTKLSSVSSTGPIQVIEDTSLSPWNYGSISRMADVGTYLANYTGSNVTTINFASLTVEGFPEFNLGTQFGINSHVSEISVSYGMNGVTTNYKLKTFFGPVPLQKKSDFDRITKFKARATVLRKDMVKLDQILKEQIQGDILYEAKEVPTITEESSHALKKQSNKNIFTATRAGRKIKGKFASHTEVRNSAKVTDGPYADLHYASVDELLFPYTTDTTSTVAPKFRNGQL